MTGSRWEQTDAPRGADYDARWESLAASGVEVHGEADLVQTLTEANGPGRRVLDAGCGTGRVAIELATRGFDAVGVDLDEAMLATARAKAPQIEWVHADLASVELTEAGRRRAFDTVVLAGNVMIFVAPGTESAVLARLAAHTRPGGLLIAGFQLRAGGLTLADYDAAAAIAGLEPVDRWATWDRAPLLADGDYAVSVHRRPSP
jgi:SAM-dependent methyltransferase